MVYEIVKMYNFGHLLAKASSNVNKTTWSLAHCAESWVPPFIRMFLFTDKKQLYIMYDCGTSVFKVYELIYCSLN